MLETYIKRHDKCKIHDVNDNSKILYKKGYIYENNKKKVVALKVIKK